MRLNSPNVGGHGQATLPACFSAGVFARTHMTFEITQLWRQITGNSLRGPEFFSLRQMFTSELGTPQSALPAQSDHWGDEMRAHVL